METTMSIEQPAEQTATTSKTSPFRYDNNNELTNKNGSFFREDNNYAFKLDGQYYAVTTWQDIQYDDKYIYPPRTYDLQYYDAASGYWVSETKDVLEKVPISDLTAQNIDPQLRNYYTTEQFRTSNIPLPMGTVFDSIYTVDALGGILDVLPVLMIVLVGFVGIRKGIGFIRSKLQRG